MKRYIYVKIGVLLKFDFSEGPFFQHKKNTRAEGTTNKNIQFEGKKSRL